MPFAYQIWKAGCQKNGRSDESEGKEKFLRNVIFLVMFTPAKKTLLKPLGSNVENGFGVIFLHANEIIMSALSGYQKQAFISSRDVVGFALQVCSKRFDVCTLIQNKYVNASVYSNSKQAIQRYLMFLIVYIEYGLFEIHFI